MKIRTTNPALFGQPTGTAAGTAFFDDDGVADVGIAVASALIGLPSFEANDDVVEAVQLFRRQVVLEQRQDPTYDAGPPSIISIITQEGPPRFRNETVGAPDNERIRFDDNGDGHCGFLTATAMADAARRAWPTDTVSVNPVERPESEPPPIGPDLPGIAQTGTPQTPSAQTDAPTGPLAEDLLAKSRKKR